MGQVSEKLYDVLGFVNTDKGEARTFQSTDLASVDGSWTNLSSMIQENVEWPS